MEDLDYSKMSTKELQKMLNELQEQAKVVRKEKNRKTMLIKHIEKTVKWLEDNGGNTTEKFAFQYDPSARSYSSRPLPTAKESLEDSNEPDLRAYRKRHDKMVEDDYTE